MGDTDISPIAMQNHQELEKGQSIDTQNLVSPTRDSVMARPNDFTEKVSALKTLRSVIDVDAQASGPAEHEVTSQEDNIMLKETNYVDEDRGFNQGGLFEGESNLQPAETHLFNVDMNQTHGIGEVDDSLQQDSHVNT